MAGFRLRRPPAWWQLATASLSEVQQQQHSVKSCALRITLALTGTGAHTGIAAASQLILSCRATAAARLAGPPIVVSGKPGHVGRRY